jgi:7-carboxy-7-deazaguanine synthase
VIKNLQPPEPRSKDGGAFLQVNSIFPTIQGEGPHAGRAAIFIRLAGCNLQCPLCDTEYTQRREMSVWDIGTETVGKHPRISLIIITGGEPFRQCIEPLVLMLLLEKREVQIETNGKLSFGAPEFWFKHLHPDQRRTIPAPLQVVVSPKTATIDPCVAINASAYKYVIKAGNVSSEDGLPISALDHPLKSGHQIARPPKEWAGPIYVQPCDEQDPAANKANMAAAVAAVTDFDDPRRRLCLQMHKYANLP